MKLSLIIPAYNEAARLERTIEQILESLGQFPAPAEVLIVDDGSADDTARKVETIIAGRDDFRLLRLPANRGKGAAVKAGMLASRGEAVLMSDADLSTPLSELPRFLAALADGSDLVVGSRQLPESNLVRRQPWLRARAGLLFGGVVRRLVPVGVVDTQCGFKLF